MVRRCFRSATISSSVLVRSDFWMRTAPSFSAKDFETVCFPLEGAPIEKIHKSLKNLKKMYVYSG